ncbi:MAG: S-layer homology domain-containing protein [Ruminococcus sp.]|nr:S-layer homology domain-containing protein [Ruminococcus sp.]
MRKKLLTLLTTALLTVTTVFSGLVVNAKDVNDYSDVHRGDWYYEYVGDVAAKELMTGLNSSTFGPTKNLARGQFATILYRMAESPATNYEYRFGDVSNGQFYSIPVTWASNTGIVTGYENGLFGTTDNITREQMATMLYRYALKTGMDVSASADYSRFPDGSKVSGFAKDAVKWAIGSGIISGNKDGTLAPQATVSRAVCATMISRFTGNTTPTTYTYVLNTNTLKFHYPSCRDVQKIHAENYATSDASRNEIINQGYSPCGHCNP